MKAASHTPIRTGGITLALSGILAALLGSPALATEGAEQALQAKVPEAYRSSGLIGVYDPQYRPTYFIDETGKIAGLTIDLQRLLAEKLGIASKEEQAKFAGIIPGILGGRYHTSHFHETAERREKMDFVGIHRTGSAVMVAKGNPKGIDLNDLCGHKVGVTSGSHQSLELIPKYQAACESAGRPTIEESAFSGMTEGALAVKSGRIDAWFGDVPAITYAVAQTDSTFEKTPTALFTGLSSFAFKKGDPLALLVRDAMALIIEDGSYQQVLEKWGMSDVGVDKAMLNGE